MAVEGKGFTMSTRRLLTLFAVTVVALVAVPAVASAGTVPMRGVVSGSPYGASNGQMAIPVLFSKQTARTTGLKSPVGVIIVKRTQQVKLPNGGGYTLPVNLRTGDRFKGLGVVGALQKRVFYPRVVFPKAVVYFRSKELSLAELSAAVDALRKALADLQTQFNLLRDGSIKAFQDLYAQMDALKKALAGLKIPAGVDLTSIQSQLDALNTKLNNLIAGLPDFSKFALASQLPDLSLYALKSQLPDLSGYLQLSDLTNQLNANSVITGLKTQVSDLSGQVTTLTNRLNNVCTALKSATVDPDGAGPLPAVGVTLPGLTAASACGP